MRAVATPIELIECTMEERNPVGAVALMRKEGIKVAAAEAFFAAFPLAKWCQNGASSGTEINVRSVYSSALSLIAVQ